MPKVLSTLDVKKANGHDMISARLLKTMAPSVAGSLTTLFNASLRLGQLNPAMINLSPTIDQCLFFQSSLKSTSAPATLRLPAGTKATQRQPIRIPLHHSTENVLIKFIDDWKKVLDKDEIVGTVLIDSSKAFDSIDHNLLLKKLDAYGVEDRGQRWLPRWEKTTSYLEWRSLTVE